MRNDKGKKKYQEPPPLLSIRDRGYSADFFMYSFKIKSCPRNSNSHQWRECPFTHRGETVHRRDPRIYRYDYVPCPDFRERGACERGDTCRNSHGPFECGMHPNYYRTMMCSMGKNCDRQVCFHAHNENQLRVSTASAAAPSTRPAAAPSTRPAAARSIFPGPAAVPSTRPADIPSTRPAVAPFPRPVVAPFPRPAVAPFPRPVVAPFPRPAVAPSPRPADAYAATGPSTSLTPAAASRGVLPSLPLPTLRSDVTSASFDLLGHEWPPLSGLTLNPSARDNTSNMAMGSSTQTQSQSNVSDMDDLFSDSRRSADPILEMDYRSPHRSAVGSPIQKRQSL